MLQLRRDKACSTNCIRVIDSCWLHAIESPERKNNLGQSRLEVIYWKGWSFIDGLFSSAYIHGAKVKHHLSFCWNNFFRTTVKKFYLIWKIYFLYETLHWHLNENDEKYAWYSDFVTKSWVFATYQNFLLSPWNLQKLTPNILKHILCHFHTHFSTFIREHKVGMKISWHPMCFLFNSMCGSR